MSTTSLLISEDVALKYFSTSVHFRHVSTLHDLSKIKVERDWILINEWQVKKILIQAKYAML
jgi:hypothetical protein